MRKLTTVLFDMDGLLFDTERLYYQGNQTAADEMGLPFSWEVFANFVGSSEHAMYEYGVEKFQSKKKAREFILRSEELVLEFMMTKEIPRKKGLESLLSYLKEKNIKMAIGSNSQRKIIELLLQRTNLTHYFSDYVGIDEVGEGKPSPDIYVKALEKTNALSGETLVIDDSINGVKAAHTAGIKAIMIPDLQQPNDEVREIGWAVLDDLHEAKELIEQTFFK